MKLYQIKENPLIKCNKEIKEYLDADYIYIPYDKDYELKIKNHELVNLNSVILTNKDKKVYSPVSGNIMGLCETIINGNLSKAIVIENNFKETSKLRGSKKDISTYSKEELLSLIKEYNACFKPITKDNLIINGIDYEPYEETLSYLISAHTDEILECIDALCKILEIDKCFFAIKNNDQENVVTLVNQIGTYPNIDLKLLPDLYPAGHPKVLLNEFHLEEENTAVLTVEDIYAIYTVLKRKRPISEKLITVSGNLLTKSKAMKVKIGTNIKDILEKEFKFKSNDYHIIINGLLSGYEINSLNAIITPEIRSVFINTIDKSRATKCINCGLCNTYCPVGADPKSGYKMNECLHCNLCTYICPAKRNPGDQNE